jgi:guanine deaminase
MTRIRATILAAPRPDELEVREDHVISVDDAGMITAVEPADAARGAVDVELPATTVLLPGLIDLHVHAPQWPQLGTGLDLPLDRWLFEYTFPLEARFGDLGFAERVWESLLPGLLSRGTTTAVYYASTHEPATLALARACVRHGQRAFVGRVAMDHPEGTPDFYRDRDALEAVAASERSIAEIEALGSPLVRPIITPRFVPACTDALLEGLGELADATGALVQTHCSESDWEHQYVLDRYGVTDAAALERFGLARPHSVLAHGGHLTDDDTGRLASIGAGIAHCPLSNLYFGNAVFPVRQALSRGLRIGLGSDIAGGAEAGLLPQCAHAVNVSRALADGVDARLGIDRRGVDGSAIDILTAFWLATVGGAEVLGIPAGRIEPGHAFDAFAIDTGPERGVEVWPEIDDWSRIFEKVVRRATPSNITHVWVAGRSVGP